ncbi:MAG: hypothetical protein DRH07_04620 [Deltaproteobacteria bacterium]|nr:MAG: hypothetical protein DRH07_04620 [Deltaproteobacteria bacterium]
MLLILVFFVSVVTIFIWLHPGEKEELKTEAEKTGKVAGTEKEKGIAPKTEKKKVGSGISVQEKKRLFTVAITPAVHHVYTDLMEQYHQAEELLKTDEGNEQIITLKTKYKVTTNEELLMALKPHPQSITIAQAAMESSWATSRFYKEANNVFGVWSFNKNDQRIAAAENRSGKTIWLKKYNSIEDSIRDYYRTLATGRAYKEFRALKMQTDDPYKLVKKLDHYSEKGAEYGRELAEIIHFNKLEAYDKTQETTNNLPEK